MTEPATSSSTARLRVCFLAGTLVRAGAERQLVYMLDALQDTDFQTRVLCLTQGEPFEERVRALGVPVTWIGREPSRLRRLWAIAENLRHEPADILQSSHFYTNIYVGLAGRVQGIPSIGAIRNDLVNEVRSNHLFGWGDLFLPRHLIANSRTGRSRAIEYGRSPERVHLLPNAVDLARFSNASAEPKPRADNEIRLLSVGRLVQQKRVDRFLRLAARLKAEFPASAMRARVAGDGPDRVDLEHTAEALGLQPLETQFLGETDDMSSLYSWADLLVLTSENEGTPNVVLEAVASGLPVVAPAVGGVPDLLAHGGGLMVRPGDDEALASATAQLAMDPVTRRTLAMEGLRYVAANHSLDGVRRTLTAIYQGVLDGDGA